MVDYVMPEISAKTAELPGSHVMSTACCSPPSELQSATFQFSSVHFVCAGFKRSPAGFLHSAAAEWSGVSRPYWADLHTRFRDNSKGLATGKAGGLRGRCAGAGEVALQLHDVYRENAAFLEPGVFAKPGWHLQTASGLIQ